MIGHDYRGGGYSGLNAVVGYGLFILPGEYLDVFDCEKLGDRYCDAEEINIEALYEDIASRTKHLTCIDTCNESIGPVLLSKALLPWEIENKSQVTAEASLREEIVKMVAPYTKISANVLSQYIEYINTGAVSEYGDYSLDLKGIHGYGIIFSEEDRKYFDFEKLEKGFESDFSAFLEQLAKESNNLEYDYMPDSDQDTYVLYFRSRMPWEYSDDTVSLTMADLDTEIMKALTMYLIDGDSHDSLRERIDIIDTCVLYG